MNVIYPIFIYIFTIYIYLFLSSIKQDNIGWVMGFGVQVGVLALALALFLLGSKWYRKESPTGSPFTRLAQVFVAATRKWHLKNKRDGHQIYWLGDEATGSHYEGQPKFQTLARTHQFRYVTCISHHVTALHIFLYLKNKIKLELELNQPLL